MALSFYVDVSLTVVHGFSSARESFLFLIDPILGKRKDTWPDVFVRLHGMLFARLQLDSFDEEMDAFVRLVNVPPIPNRAEWAYLAITSIAALYQYNRKDSLLKEALRQGRRGKREADFEDGVTVTEDAVEAGSILHPVQEMENLETDVTNAKTFTNMPLDIRTDDVEDVSLSKIVFEKSCLLAFSLLSRTLNEETDDTGPLVFIHVWLVFLAYSLRYQPIVRLLERRIPWQELVEHLNKIRIFNDLKEELPESVLVEDLMMRGFEWSRKQIPKNWFQNVDCSVEVLETAGKGLLERMERIRSLGIQISKVSIYDLLLLRHRYVIVSNSVRSFELQKR